MKLKKIALRNFAILLAIAFGFIACDDEFATIDSDIINDDTATNFETTSERYEVISYTDVLEPIQTNSLGLYQLGVYNDPIYGQTVASILTQVNSGLIDPSFGENVVLDSVVLTIPYFSTNLGVSEENTIEYEIDSVFTDAGEFDPIKLSIYENSYFLRDFNPNEDFNIRQSYFSNKSASTSEDISVSDLEGFEIATINELEISEEEVILTDNDETEPLVTARLSPRIREVWRNNDTNDTDVINYWKSKILDQEGEIVLSNPNNFNDYFRGIYFKAETVNGTGSLLLLNLSIQESNITLHYSFDSPTVDGERDESEYVLTFGDNRVNFFENNFNANFPSQDGDQVNGEENLFLKGGEGSVAGIKLFNGENSDDDDTTDNTFETWRKQFVNLDEDGEFESSKRLVNEANLVFYVNQGIVQGNEPERLYLYNRTVGAPLADYVQDIQNNSLPQISIPNHLGILERDETTDRGIRYKMRITSHINNLLLNNGENVELGLAISGNVNLEATIAQYSVQTTGPINETVPVSSIVTPRGTVVRGNLDTGSNSDERLVLEIFYTEPN